MLTAGLPCCCDPRSLDSFHSQSLDIPHLTCRVNLAFCKMCFLSEFFPSVAGRDNKMRTRSFFIKKLPFPPCRKWSHVFIRNFGVIPTLIRGGWLPISHVRNFLFGKSLRLLKFYESSIHAIFRRTLGSSFSLPFLIFPYIFSLRFFLFCFLFSFPNCLSKVV